MSEFLELTEDLKTAVGQLNQVLQGDENTTVMIDGEEKPSVQKKTLDTVNAQVQLVLDAAADIDAVKYANTAAGIAATTNGQFFSVVSQDDDSYLELYENESNMAVLKKIYLSSKGVAKKITSIPSSSSLSLSQISTNYKFQNVDELKKINTSNITSTGLNISLSSEGLLVESSSSGGIMGIVVGNYDLIPIGSNFIINLNSIEGESKNFGFSIGKGDARKWVAWGASGGLVVYDNNYTISDVLLKSETSRSYLDGDSISITGKRVDENSYHISLLKNGIEVAESFFISSLSEGFSICFRGLLTANVFELRWLGYTDHKISLLEKEIDSLNNEKLSEKLGISSNEKLSTSNAAASDVTSAENENGTLVDVNNTQGLVAIDTGYKASDYFKLIYDVEKIRGGRFSGVNIDNKWYVWTGSGALVEYDNNYNRNVLAPSSNDREYTEGDSLAMAFSKSSTGYSLQLFIGNVSVYSQVIENEIKGNIYAVVGGDGVYLFKELIEADNLKIVTDSVADLKSAYHFEQTALFERSSVLPDYPSSRDNHGFTCTGLGFITRGKFAGFWVVGDDGRIAEGDNSDYAPALHIFDNDFRKIIKTIIMPYSGASVQGIAIDTSGSKDTIWVATSGDKKVRHFDVEGNEITENTIVFSEITMAGSANGLSYDSDNHALWVSNDTNTDLFLVSCDESLSDRVLMKTTSELKIDHSFYIPSHNKLYYQPSGRDTEDDYIIGKDIATGKETVAYSLKFGSSVEGFHIDIESKKLTCVSDAGYHFNSASPAFNTVNVYKIKV